MKKGLAPLCFGALFLICLGVAMVASVSDAQAVRFGKSANYFAVRQFVFAFCGSILAFFLLPRFDYHFLKKRWVVVLLLLMVGFGLVSVWIPGLADVAHKGSSRWVRLGPIQIQPSEFVRVAVCILYAKWCSGIRRHNEYFWRGVILPLVALLPILVLFVKQPDYGSTLLVLAVVLAVLYAAGAKLAHIILVGLMGAAILCVGLFADPEHRSRITSVYASETADADDTHQINASLKAFRRGGINGVGYGGGLMKEGHLPEAHTDFILAMTGEELGFRVTLLVVVGNLLLLYGGWQISRHCTDRFGKVLAFGLMLHLCLASAANIAVVTKLAPTKGLALPFMSYGGSNMLASSVVLGLLISIACNGETGFAHKPILLGR